MTRKIIALLLLTLAISGCVVGPGGYYGGRGYGNGGWSEHGGGEGGPPRHWDH